MKKSIYTFIFLSATLVLVTESQATQKKSHHHHRHHHKAHGTTYIYEEVPVQRPGFVERTASGVGSGVADVGKGVGTGVAKVGRGVGDAISSIL